jgi:hypothetical protein
MRIRAEQKQAGLSSFEKALNADIAQCVVQCLPIGDWSSLRRASREVNEKIKKMARPISALYLSSGHRWTWHTEEVEKGLAPFAASIRHLHMEHTDSPSRRPRFYVPFWNQMPNLETLRLRLPKHRYAGAFWMNDDRWKPMPHLRVLDIRGMGGFASFATIDTLLPSLVHLCMHDMTMFSPATELLTLARSRVGRQLQTLVLEMALHENYPDDFWQVFLKGCSSLTSIDLTNAVGIAKAIVCIGEQGGKWRDVCFPIELYDESAPKALTVDELAPLRRCTELRKLCLPIDNMNDLPLDAWPHLEELSSTAEDGMIVQASRVPKTLVKIDIVGAYRMDHQNSSFLPDLPTANLSHVLPDVAHPLDVCQTVMSRFPRLASLRVDQENRPRLWRFPDAFQPSTWWPQLVCLRLVGFYATDALLRPLSALRHLRLLCVGAPFYQEPSVTLPDSILSDAGLQELSHCTALENVQLLDTTQNSCTLAGVEAFARPLRRLYRLVLRQMETIPDDGPVWTLLRPRCSIELRSVNGSGYSHGHQFDF